MAEHGPSEKSDETPSDVPEQPSPEQGPEPSGQGPPPPGGEGPAGGPSGGPPPPPPPEGTVPPAGDEMPPELQTMGVSKDEKTWAMIGHLAALAGLLHVPFANVIGPLVVWLLKKDESPFVAFHAKQCMFLHLFAAGTALVMAILGFLLCVPFFLAAVAWYGAMAYSIVAAIKISNGEDFEYYWVGPWVRKSLS